MSSSISKRPKIFNHWRMVMIFLIAYDFIAILFSYLVALWVRFDCNFGDVPEVYLQTYFKTIFIYAIFCILVFWVAKLYRSIWRFASYMELIRVIASTIITGVVYTISVCVFVTRMPVSYFIFEEIHRTVSSFCNNADFSNTII